MNRSARVFAALALATALCSAMRVGASPLGISYARVFDTDPSHNTFVVGDVAFARADNLVSDAVFGIDVQLPDLAPASVSLEQFSAAPEAAYEVPGVPGSIATPYPVVTLRLHQASLQVQYGGLSANAASLGYRGSMQTDTALAQPGAGAHFGYAAPSASPDRSAQALYAYPLASSGTFAARAFPAYAPGAQGLELQPTLPVRIGKFQFTGSVDSSHAGSLSRPNAFNALQLCGNSEPASVCPYYAGITGNEDRLSATTNFNVRAGARNVNLGVSGGLEHLQLSDQSTFPYVPWSAGIPSAQQARSLTGDGSYYPGGVDVTKAHLNASVAVPITQEVTLGLGYDTQHYVGSYGAVAEPNIDARKNLYLGNLTYQIPHTSSQITLSARQYRYQDSFVPSFTAKQTRADVNFTVKF